jgi:hypothetical protein
LTPKFSIERNDADAVLPLLAAIAERFHLTFALTPNPSPEVLSDSWNKSADYAMANGVVTESCLHLLGSTCPEHQAKGFSLHFGGDLSQLEADASRKRRFVEAVRQELAKVHQVGAEHIRMMGLVKGSIRVIYTVAGALPASPADAQTAAERVFRREEWNRDFPGHPLVSFDIHPAFSHLHINPAVFDPQWNRDFRIPGNCPTNERRGGFPYTPPAGWKRYGMLVEGRFQPDDLWLGMVNGPGEWAVVYHGTKWKFVDPVSNTPLKPGPLNAYGYGIYCSPNPLVAEKYADVLDVQTEAGIRKCKFMFVCRVNVRDVHHCTNCPCDLATDDGYTVHITTETDIWFANGQNGGYQNIRAYGILVKEV